MSLVTPRLATLININSVVRPCRRDAHTQCESMKILAKKMILYKKCIVNARIVGPPTPTTSRPSYSQIVVGASDTGLSTLSSLMSMPRLHFTSLTLLAPGGISYFLDDELDRRRMMTTALWQASVPHSTHRSRSLSVTSVQEPGVRERPHSVAPPSEAFDCHYWRVRISM